MAQRGNKSYKPSTTGARAQMKEDAALLAATAREERLYRARQQQAAFRAGQQGAFIYGGGGAMAKETKYFDVGINTAVTTAGTTWADTEVPADNYVNSSGSPAAYTDCTLIPTAQGTGYGQVVGQRYQLKKLRVRGDVATAVSSTGTSVSGPLSVRLMLVMDTQPIGSAGAGGQAQGEEIMQDFGDTPENAYSFQRVAAATGRFRVLKDFLCVLQPLVAVNDAAATTVSTSRSAAQFSFQYRPKTPLQIQIRNGNATPTVAGVQSHNIFLLAYAYTSAAGQGAATAVTIKAASRCYYAD